MSIHTQINRAMSHAQLAIAPGTGHGLPADRAEKSLISYVMVK
jgi:hypothetical protein